jgi:predicted lipoprotein with Yx(FWY)xxD motif
VVVRTTMNKKIGKDILVTLRGLTLYSLSAERNGRFICTDAYCKSLWTPLVVTKGTTPSGAHLLATVERPDGRTQVTYKGLPLYTFNEDTKPGDTKGDGFRDVGVWRPATPTGSTGTPATGTPFHYCRMRMRAEDRTRELLGGGVFAEELRRLARVDALLRRLVREEDRKPSPQRPDVKGGS